MSNQKQVLLDRLKSWSGRDDAPYWAKIIPSTSKTLTFGFFPPGTTLPKGLIGIRSDGDFFAEAALPWEFHVLTREEIAKTLWPTVNFAITEDTPEGYMFFKLRIDKM